MGSVLQIFAAILKKISTHDINKVSYITGSSYFVFSDILMCISVIIVIKFR